MVLPVLVISPTHPGQKRSNHSESISLTQHQSNKSSGCRQRHRQQSIITISSNSDIFSSSIKRLQITSVLPKTEKMESNDIMDLCSSPEDHKLPSQATKLGSFPTRLPHVPKCEPVVIDLCTPESKRHCIERLGQPKLTAAQASLRLVEPALRSFAKVVYLKAGSSDEQG